MAIDDAARLHLYEQARSTWDAEAANTLINSMPTPTDRIATRDDLTVLSAELRAEIAEIRAEIAEIRAEIGAEMRTELAGVRGEMRTELAGVRGELHGLRSEMHKGFADQTRRFFFGLVASNATLVGLVFAAVKLA